MIQEIETFPARLIRLIKKYDPSRMDPSYRREGWTVRQIVHHLADAHLIAYTRFKLALTEKNPVIKSYNENAWAELIDAKTLPVSVSLRLLRAVHARWVTLLKAMNEENFRRCFYHPQRMKTHNLYELLAMYAWHGRHHYMHISMVSPARSAHADRRQKQKSLKKTEKGRPNKTDRTKRNHH